MSIESEVQNLHADNIVTLYELDTTVVGGVDIFRFTRKSRESAEIQFGGNTYTPIDIEATGFLWDGKGAFPRPKLKVSNVAGLVSAAIISQNDLIGSRLIRTRTFEQFLDDGSNPDPTAMFPQDIYVVEQKTNQNKVFVEWQLSSALDQTGRQLPGRQCLRDRCTHTYRIWNSVAGAFDYANASCPYVGSVYYDENGVSVTGAVADTCGRRLTDCRLRFGQNGVLPTRAFPGIARTRIR